MAKRQVTLAKLSRPNAFALLGRERIFTLLQGHCRHRAVWVCGAPGAGKTTAVASYLEKSRRSGIWYQVDTIDADPAAFFHHLAIAAAAGKRRERKSPTYPPTYPLETWPQLAVFARNYFRKLYSAMPPGSTIVFDNMPSFAPPVFMRTIIPIACEEIPEGITVFMISRAAPPPELSRLIASRVMAVMDHRALRFTLAEVQQLTLAEGLTGEGLAADLHRTTDGWATGTILALSYRKHVAAHKASTSAASERALFDYFATQVLAMTLPEMRNFLIRTALLPSFTTTIAEIASGDANTNKHLEYLSRNHIFIEINNDAEITTYCYDYPFREFLIAVAKTDLAADEIRAIRHRVAKHLETQDRADQAVSMYLIAHEWGEAVRLILDVAQRVYLCNQHRLLSAWIGQVPREIRCSSPWLIYWDGRCSVATNPSLGRVILTEAYTAALRNADSALALLCVAAVVETFHLERHDLVPLDNWLAELERLMPPLSRRPCCDAAHTIAYSAWIFAAVVRQPRHQMLPSLVSQAIAMLHDETTPNAHDLSIVATSLLRYAIGIGASAQAEPIVAHVRPMLARTDIAPLQRAILLLYYARYCAVSGDLEAATDSYRRLTDIGIENTISLESIVRIEQLLSSTFTANEVQAKALLAALPRPAVPRPRVDAATLEYVHAWIAMQDGNMTSALRAARAASELALAVGAIDLTASCFLLLAEIHIEQDELGAAHALSARVLADASPAMRHWVECHWQMLQARHALLQEQSDAACAHLHTVLAAAKAGAYLRLTHNPRVGTRLCRFALTQGIEVDYVHEMIRKLGYQCDSPEIQNWLWPIKVYCLGRFALLINDVPLRAIGKAQRRPLELLKFLVALGGREVSAVALIHSLWPESEGDAGQATLDSTVHRLRKLLGRDDAIVVGDGRLTLNTQVVWVDVWAFERLLGKVETLVCLGARTQSISDVAGTAFRLYQGHFLGHEEERPITLGMRDKLRSKWLRNVLALGQFWETNGECDRAADLYQRGLELDTLAEELYRRLIAIYQRRGQRATALEVYRRCRHTLSVVLGVAPSPETEALSRALRNV